jgi:hypothetical protein
MMVIIPNDYSSFNNLGGFGNQDSYDNSDSSGRKVIHDVEEHDKRN